MRCHFASARRWVLLKANPFFSEKVYSWTLYLRVSTVTLPFEMMILSRISYSSACCWSRLEMVSNLCFLRFPFLDVPWKILNVLVGQVILDSRNYLWIQLPQEWRFLPFGRWSRRLLHQQISKYLYFGRPVRTNRKHTIWRPKEPMLKVMLRRDPKQGWRNNHDPRKVKHISNDSQGVQMSYWMNLVKTTFKKSNL